MHRRGTPTIAERAQPHLPPHLPPGVPPLLSAVVDHEKLKEGRVSSKAIADRSGRACVSGHSPIPMRKDRTDSRGVRDVR